MVKLRRLELTENVRARLAIVELATSYTSGSGEPLSPGGLDLLKLELANEVIAEVRRQEMVRGARIEQLDALPRRPVPVVEVALRRKPRRRA